jgi:hypothetical protein
MTIPDDNPRWLPQMITPRWQHLGIVMWGLSSWGSHLGLSSGGCHLGIVIWGLSSWGSHLGLSSGGCHLGLSSGVVIWRCYLRLSSGVVIWCCHLVLSSGVVICGCHLGLSSGVVIWVVIWCCHLRWLTPHFIYLLKTLFTPLSLQKFPNIWYVVPCRNRV